MSVKFPDVPFFDGVPSVFRNAENAISTSVGVSEARADAAAGITVVGPKGWGIYRSDGTLALDADSVVAVEPSREFRISDYPQEAGGFQSYNKVATPGEVRITVTKGGYRESERRTFLRALDDMVQSTDLFLIVTPEAVFESRNVVRWDYRRTAENGARMITVEILAIEVRETAETQFSTTKKPSGADPVTTGPVRPVAAEAPTGAPS